MRWMRRSLKDPRTNKVKPVEEPLLFRFGLLHVAGVPELIALAEPTTVHLE